MTGSSPAIALIAAMITPAVLILASASLVASALVRMARVVDRARNLVAIAYERTPEKAGVTAEVLRTWLEDHARRARHAEQAIALLYGAVVSFIATCLSIALDRAVSGSLAWLPVSLAVLGTLLLFGGGAEMVAESRLSGKQIQDEIHRALGQMEARK
ncbi:MAG TPA: DUF2721 domain-containing protein [Vicinamibacterales bacterium]|nr:DUF2721 domain-containing protein [Vicinamibacterales bacterium]